MHLVHCWSQGSLRSKRSLGFFPRFKTFFASWPRKNWGERKKCLPLLPPSIFFALAQFFRGQKKKWEKPTEKRQG